MRGFLITASICLVASYLGLAEGQAQLTTSDISLKISRRTVTFGEGLVLEGRIQAPRDLCFSSTEVVIVQDLADDRAYDWREVARVRTNDSGKYRTTLMPEGTVAYRAEIAEPPAGCGSGMSRRRVVRVRLHVSLRPNDNQIEKSSSVELRTRVSPTCFSKSARLTFNLYRFSQGEFTKVDSARPNRRCIGVFERKLNRQTVFQVRVPEAVSLAYVYSPGRSPQKVVGVE